MFLPTFKRCAALFLAVISLLVLCSACTEQQSTDKPQTTQTTQTTRPTTPTPEASYAAALAALAEKNYTEAHALLSALGDYKDAPALLEKFVFRPTEIRSIGELIREHCTVFTYDEQGNCVKITEDDSTQLVFTYEKIGCPTQKQVLFAGEQSYVTNYVYDEAARLVEEIKKTEYNEYTVCYEYDENGRLKKRIMTCDDDIYSEPEVLEFFYDEHGNCIETYGHYAVGDHVNEYTYDENGRCIRQINPYGDESTFQYDACGNRIKEIYVPYEEERGECVVTYTYEPFYFEGGIPGDWKNFIDRFVYDMY